MVIYGDKLIYGDLCWFMVTLRLWWWLELSMVIFGDKLIYGDLW